MAKKWTPSLKQLSAYDELLKRQNIARKRLLRRRRVAEEEGSFGRPLPDLVIPMKAKRHRDMSRYKPRFDSYEDYRNKMRALQNLYGGKGSPELQYYKESYKKNILNIIKGWIQDPNIVGFGDKPKGYFGKYTEEQIQEANQVANDGGRYLEFYNDLITTYTGEFMDMYDSGMIPTLKYIYAEMTSDKASFSQIDEFVNNFSDYRRQVREKNVMTSPESVEERRESLKSSLRNSLGQFVKKL